MNANLARIERKAPEVVLAGLRDPESRSKSKEAGLKLVQSAKDSGLCMKDYLTLAIDPTKSETPRRYECADGVLDGFEAALAHLQLPFRDDFKNGVMLQAASDTFQTFPGTRAMFPEVIDSMLRWKNRQDQIEKVEPMVAQSRTIQGTEMISTAVEDDSKDRGTFSISEFGQIPVRTLRTSQSAVGIFKHGSGIRTSYEFERRAGLDLLTPFAARVARELEISKVKAATNVLINGDGINGAATAINFSDSSIGGVAVGTTALSAQYKPFAKWLVARAKAGLPIDTLVANFDIYLELLFMFTPTVNGVSVAEAMQTRTGVNLNLPVLGGNVNFVLSSSMPANKILGYSKADTLEELIEAGSTISENERSMENQSVLYTRTENSGYKLAFADTRSLLNLAA